MKAISHVIMVIAHLGSRMEVISEVCSNEVSLEYANYIIFILNANDCI